MHTRTETALTKFFSGYNCAQAILYTFGPGLGMDGETALKVATGFGAGIARRGETCGAVTGGIMALSLKFGRGENQDRSATETAYRKAQDLMARFEQAHGSCRCLTLLNGCDLTKPEGQQQFRDENMLHTRCGKYVETVTGILDSMLGAEQQGGDKNPAQAGNLK